MTISSEFAKADSPATGNPPQPHSAEQKRESAAALPPSATHWLTDYNQRLDRLPIDQTTKDARRWKSKGKSSEADLAALEKALGFSVPASLRDFYLNHGAFASESFADEWQTVDVFKPDQTTQKGIGLARAIDIHWGGRPEIAAHLSAKAIARINSTTAVWGIRHINDNECVYYYFDHTGGIGFLYLDQDDMTSALECLADISKGTPTGRQPLERLLSDEAEAMLEVEEDSSAFQPQ